MRQHPDSDFLRHSLSPSHTSGFLCIVTGIVTVGVGVLQTTLAHGTPINGVAPEASGSPSIDHIFSQASWHHLGVMVLQIFFLVFLFGVIDFLFAGYANLKKTSRDQKNISESQWLFERAYWRLFVGLAAIVVGFLLIQLIHWASSVEEVQVGLPRTLIMTSVWRTAVACLIWALTYHAAIVFVRLFTFRPRLLRHHE